MEERHAVAAQLFGAIVILLMVWLSWHVVTTEGLTLSLLLPISIVAVLVFSLLVLRNGIRGVVLAIFWSAALAFFVSGLVNGETGFPGKLGRLNVSLHDQPILFWSAMLANLLVLFLGAALAAKDFHARQR